MIKNQIRYNYTEKDFFSVWEPIQSQDSVIFFENDTCEDISYAWLEFKEPSSDGDDGNGVQNYQLLIEKEKEFQENIKKYNPQSMV